MSTERWDRLKELFDGALDRAPGERQAFLEAECRDDPELLAEVQALLAADREDDFLEREEPSGSVAGQRFGDYVLLEELGSGGTGIVYRARQEGLDREVALKVMPHHLATDRARVNRFRREAKAAASLRHPGIAPIHDYGSHRDATGEHHYFSMELVPGHDLFRELELQTTGVGILPAGPGQAHQRAVAEVVRRCAQALAHAHGAGVVHRDIKPNNIVLEPSGEPRLVDFGLARDERLGSITVTDAVQGTPYYMSPEQARALSDRVDERTDIYSLGVVLYELLSRSKPFTGRTSQEVLHQIVVREPAPLERVAPRVDRDLAVVCAKAMEKRPEDRYQSAEELAADLGRYLAGEPILARPPGLARRLTRRVARHRQTLTATTAVLVTVLALWGGSEARAYLALPELQLEVLFADPDLDLAAVRAEGPLAVTATPLDDFSGRPVGPVRELGAGALDGFRLPEGTWRVTVAVGGFEPVELDRRIGHERGVPPLRARFLDPSERPALLDYAAGVQPWGRPKASHGYEALPGLSYPGLQDAGASGADVDLGSFALEPFEVSFGRYRTYLLESKDELPEAWVDYDLSMIPDELPVMQLSDLEAQRFAEWYGLRLPYVPELEFATRGPELREVPWAGDPTEERANVYHQRPAVKAGRGVDVEDFLRCAEPVDSRPEAATPEGLHHGLGNVAELTFSTTNLPGPTGPTPMLVHYGGPWLLAQFALPRLPALGTGDFGSALPRDWMGFRCARTR